MTARFGRSISNRDRTRGRGCCRRSRSELFALGSTG
jgi:hypothetical protein